jgi:hypothetical protein
MPTIPPIVILYRIDTETDSLIDSIQYEMQGNEDYEAGQVAASPNGRYLAVSYVDNLAEQYLMRDHDARTMQNNCGSARADYPDMLSSGKRHPVDT